MQFYVRPNSVGHVLLNRPICTSSGPVRMHPYGAMVNRDLIRTKLLKDGFIAMKETINNGNVDDEKWRRGKWIQ